MGEFACLRHDVTALRRPTARLPGTRLGILSDGDLESGSTNSKEAVTGSTGDMSGRGRGGDGYRPTCRSIWPLRPALVWLEDV